MDTRKMRRPTPTQQNSQHNKTAIPDQLASGSVSPSLTLTTYQGWNCKILETSATLDYLNDMFS